MYNICILSNAKMCLMYNTHSIKETILKGTIVIIEYMAEMFMPKKNLLRNVSVLFLLFVAIVSLYISKVSDLIHDEPGLPYDKEH